MPGRVLVGQMSSAQDSGHEREDAPMNDVLVRECEEGMANHAVDSREAAMLIDRAARLPAAALPCFS